MIRSLKYVINREGNKDKLHILSEFTVVSNAGRMVFDHAIVDKENQHVFLLVKILEADSQDIMFSMMKSISTVYGYVFVTPGRLYVFDNEWKPAQYDRVTFKNFLDTIVYIDLEDNHGIYGDGDNLAGLTAAAKAKLLLYCPGIKTRGAFTIKGVHTVLLPKITISTCKRGRLYRYMSMQALDRIIGNGPDFQWALSSICSMNDKWEYFYAKKRDGSIVDFRNSQVKNTYIMSLSSANPKTSLDMWRFYGNQCRGVCLEFRITGNSVRRVKYIKGYQGYPSFPIYFIYKGIVMQLLAPIDSNTQFCLKSSLYSSEAESRIVMTAGNPSNWYMTSDTPFPSLAVKSDNLPLELVRIHIGPNSENSTVKTEMLRLKLERWHKNIEVVQTPDMGYLP